MKSLHWVFHVFSIELRRVFAYRVAFWVNFFLGITAELLVAYFFWTAMFESRGVTILEGFSFRGILYYYIIGATAQRIVRASAEGIIAQEIYDGSLNRYLLYPLPFLGYKWVTLFAHQVLAITQLLCGLVVAIMILGRAPEQNLTITSVALGIFTTLIAGYLYYSVSVMLEMVAFWQDTVWNLLAMFRFISTLLGGLSIPLVFFPTWASQALAWTPFPYLFSFPLQTFLGQLSAAQWLTQLVILVSWSVLFTLMTQSVWRAGTKQYSGVGI